MPTQLIDETSITVLSQIQCKEIISFTWKWFLSKIQCKEITAFTWNPIIHMTRSKGAILFLFSNKSTIFVRNSDDEQGGGGKEFHGVKQSAEKSEL